MLDYFTHLGIVCDLQFHLPIKVHRAFYDGVRIHDQSGSVYFSVKDRTGLVKYDIAGDITTVQQTDIAVGGFDIPEDLGSA